MNGGWGHSRKVPPGHPQPPIESERWPTVYLTKEQLHRLSGLACDALVGIQLHTDASDMTAVRYEFVPIDNPGSSHLQMGIVHTDGRYYDES